MLPESAPELTTNELLHLIEEARNIELCRDLDSLREILLTVWNIEETPRFDNYEEPIKAELLRLCGVFLSFYGFARSLKDYQIRGKNLLMNAAEIFEENKISDKAAEAKINLAFCYWNLGEVNEMEAILNMVESDFSKNLLHPIYLRVRLNRLLIHLWKQDIKSGLEVIDDIALSMQFCTDLRLLAMFHNQAGIFYRISKNYNKAVFHLNEAVRFADEAKNKLFAAFNFNNLALVYKDIKDFQSALKYITDSIEQAEKLNNKGFLPHALDTKALIFLDWNKPKNALDTIKKSIESFKKGEDYRGLTDAIWTKVRCLLRLGRKEDALADFVELENIAAEQIGEIAVKKFRKHLSDELYVLRNLPLAEEVNEFRKERVSAALIEAKGVIGKAAQILRLKNHQALSDILNKQFPELMDELGFQRRAKRRSKIERPERNFSTPQTWEIVPLKLEDKHFAFEFEVWFDTFETFHFEKYAMQIFGVESASVVAVAPVSKIKAGMFILCADEYRFFAGKAEYDDWSGIYFIQDENGYPTPFEKENIIGEPVAFCPSALAEDKTIKFSRFRADFD